ncbi:MAG: 4Fe-4S binding protein [Anaerolineae bacterium]|nr:4Fe-4S binding protein [Anaerolineae bacterium]
MPCRIFSSADYEKGHTVKREFWSGLIKPSTRAFVREARRTPGYSFFDWLHGYIYARWPYLYIGLGTGEHPLARVLSPLLRRLARLFPPRAISDRSSERVTFADTYHGKVLPLEAAKRLVSVKEEISLTNLEQVIPYSRARDIVLRNPDHIVALECPCRASRPNPCLPLDVCLIVGEPFATFVAEHHPRRSRWITPEEAVEILRAEHERGHVHHAFFKDAMLGRFYAICNCCSCCCGAMQAWRGGTPMLAPSGYVSRVDDELCIGCSLCADSCPFGALALEEGVAVVDGEACMGCGVCVSKCAQGALSLVREPGKGEPLEIHELMATAIQSCE